MNVTRKDLKGTFGCRIFVPYDENTNLGLIVKLVDDKGKIHPCEFVVMCHKEENDEGVIFWFDCKEI